MTKTEVKNFRNDFQSAISQLEEKYGAKISLGTIRFDDKGLRSTMKLEKGASTVRITKESLKVGDIVKINHRTVNENDRFRVIKIMSKNIKVVKTNVPEGRIAGEIRVSPSLLEVA